VLRESIALPTRVTSVAGTIVRKGGTMKPHPWIVVMAALATGTALAAPNVVIKQCFSAHASRAALRTSLRCNMDLRVARRSPVLLVPGTTLTPDENFSWNYVAAFDAMGWPVCTVELPEHALADIQLAAEHITFAIREAWRLSGHRVQVIGFSQGGMAPRWALRFSPDTRHKVEDLISLSGSHHGGVIADLFCGAFASPDPSGVVGCEAAFWQQRLGSAFLATLNSGYETVPEVDYTAIYTLTDDVLIENGTSAPTSVLKDAGNNIANIALQDVCPANSAGHTAIGTYDPVGWAIALDALEHDGPARIDRLLAGGAPGSSPVCGETLMPGVDPSTLASNVDALTEATATALFNGTHLTAEPLLACYSNGDGPKHR
jgi:triacylglycerol esterase/lipase EstA (alpha/beta hydrolase family)